MTTIGRDMYLAMGALALMKAQKRAQREQPEWAVMEQPHCFPPNPFESRQVRRARERRERKAMNK